MFPVLTPKPRPSAARLLFVGNGLDEHLSLQRILDGWTIHTAGTCAQAIQMLDAERPTVIVCEEELPDGSWRSLVAAAKSLPSPAPVIVLSRGENEQLWTEVLRSGGFDVVACPLDPFRVSLAFYEALTRSRAESEIQVPRMAAQGY